MHRTKYPGGYADDFVVLHDQERVVRECRAVVAGWLAGMGLELKPSKTRVCHTKLRRSVTIIG